TQLDLNSLGAVAAQSSGSGASASRAIDGNTSTFSQTSNLSNSFWEVTLNRRVQISKIQLMPTAWDIASNLVLRVYDLYGQTVFQATVNGVSTDTNGLPVWSTNLPAGIYGRTVHFGLENGQTNGAGSFIVSIAEVQVFGDPSATLGPSAMA